MTRAVPAASHRVKGSPRIQIPMRMVDSGPTMPACAAMPAPMRSMAIMTMSTGAAVQRMAFSTDSHNTSGATMAAPKGRSATNWARQHRQATVVAKPTRRSAPMRCTISPL